MIAITGASGHIGQLLTAELAARTDPRQVRLVTRHPAKVADAARVGFDVAAADYGDPASMVSAYQGAGVLLIVSSEGPVEMRLAHHRAAIAAAKAARVGRVVYTSFTAASSTSLCPFGHVHAQTEDDLRASGLTYTILRNNQYAELLDTTIAMSMGTRKLALPRADGRAAYIARRDVAAAIAGALIGPGHDNKVYEVTGTEAVNLYDIAEVVGARRGEQIEVIDADPYQYAQLVWWPVNVPQFIVEGMFGTYDAMRAGEFERVTGDAALLAGRPITDIRDYIRRLP